MRVMFPLDHTLHMDLHLHPMDRGKDHSSAVDVFIEFLLGISNQCRIMLEQTTYQSLMKSYGSLQ
jgi:hypothetical protein